MQPSLSQRRVPVHILLEIVQQTAKPPDGRGGCYFLTHTPRRWYFLYFWTDNIFWRQSAPTGRSFSFNIINFVPFYLYFLLYFLFVINDTQPPTSEHNCSVLKKNKRKLIRFYEVGWWEVGSERFVCIVSPVRPVRPASIPSALSGSSLYILYQPVGGWRLVLNNSRSQRRVMSAAMWPCRVSSIWFFLFLLLLLLVYRHPLSNAFPCCTDRDRPTERPTDRPAGNRRRMGWGPVYIKQQTIQSLFSFFF
jgi:hypothetical protein